MGVQARLLVDAAPGKALASKAQRVKALIRHKLSPDYDPTMIDPE